jgi:hypothetical protein
LVNFYPSGAVTNPSVAAMPQHIYFFAFFVGMVFAVFSAVFPVSGYVDSPARRGYPTPLLQLR